MIVKKILSIVLVVLLTLGLCFVPNIGTNFCYAQSATVISDSVNVRSGAGRDNAWLGKVASGYRIEITGQAYDPEGSIWYQFNYDGKTAYIKGIFLRLNPTYTWDNNFEIGLNTQGFPNEYKPYLRELHQLYPTWVFTTLMVNDDFANAVENEHAGTRTLVAATAVSSHKSTDVGKYDWNTSKWPTFDGSAWNAASKEIIAYYLDPRNFLSETAVFQFEKHTYNPYYQTRDGVYQMIKGTFLDSFINCEGLSSYSNQVGVGMQNSINTIGPTATDGSAPSSVINTSNDAAVVSDANSSTVVQETTQASQNVIIGGAPGSLTPYSKLDEVFAYSNLDGPGATISNELSGVSQVIGPGIANGTNENTQSVINSNTVQMNNSIAAVDETGSVMFTYLPAGQYHMADVIYNACSQANVNPYAFIAMILQEQGKEGKTEAVSGTNAKFPGNYNYINVNASFGNGLTASENGLLYVATAGTHGRPWNTKEKAIYGAASYYSSQFIAAGQDTFYLKKWNVQGDNMYKHQYMTNVEGAAKEGYILSSSYNDGLKAQTHEFEIPVYRNMPTTVCPYPTKNGSPNNKLKALGVNGYTISPTFNMDTNEYSLIVPTNVDNVTIQAVACDPKAAIAGTGRVNLVSTITKANVLVVAENTDQRVYTINITRQGYIGNTAVSEAGAVNNAQTQQTQIPTSIPNAITVPDLGNSNNNTYANSNNDGLVASGPPMSGNSDTSSGLIAANGPGQ